MVYFFYINIYTIERIIKMIEKKIFNVRIEKELWCFLKKKGVDKDKSLNEMIVDLIKNYKKKCESKLTDNGMKV